MMAGDELDIEALLDAPLKQQLKQRQASSMIEEVRRSDNDVEYPVKDHREDRRRHERRRSRSRERGRRHHRSRSRSRDRRHHRAEPEVVPAYKAPLSEAQRDRRTVFCRQLAQRVRSEDLHSFFESSATPCHVRDARIVYDRISNRSKGVAYVEFVDEADVQRAIKVSGQKLCGIPIIVELTETEKNRLAEEAAEAAKKGKAAPGSSVAAPASNGTVSFGRITKVFVGGLHYSIDEKALRKVFDPFGDIEYVEFLPENKGTAHIHFKNASDAGMAVDQMNGFELVGRPIRAGILRDRMDGSSSVQYRPGDIFTANLDDAETQGLTLNAKTRTELMQKLARDSAGFPGGPSPCLLLTGMYDPSAEIELGWEHALADDIREECSRFGSIHHLQVAKSKEGDVWLRFASQAAGQDALKSLNGRWFGGKQIKASFVSIADYERRFPGSS